MHFCSNCHNMYYLKIRDAEEGANSLIYYCRNCGNEDTTLTSENICVSETQLRRSEQKYTHMVNEYTKYDPTLPRINSIKCPNQDCISNTKLGGAKPKATVAATAAEDTKKKPVLKVKTTKKALAQAEQAQQIQAQQIQAQQIQAQQIETQIAAQEQLVEQQAQAALTEAEQVKAAAEQLIEGKEEKEEKGEKEEGQKGESMREVIYIRYDDINMKYVYLCVHCDTTWKTDNRI